MTPLEELGQLLRPAGGGVHLVSTGRAEQEALQRALYRAKDEAEIQTRWKATLAKIPSARAIILGIPSDVGAGFLRGSNMGPAALRTALFEEATDLPAQLEAAGVVDIGDVFVCPQLLHDDMLSESQKAASRRALYPTLPGNTLPVSPLSIAERAMDLVFQLNPKVKPIVLGGDHSCAWPIVSAISRIQKQGDWGIVQPDAHTDLLEERLGVKYCFATWSFHANNLVGRKGRLTQVGTRASRFPREHWEKTCDVRQFWAEEVNRDEGKALDEMIRHLKSTGVTKLYFSNDIDGTDEEHADATGTPEPKGLSPEFLVQLIRKLGENFELLGGDVMEVAPPMQRREGGAKRTVSLGARYLRETLSAMLGARFDTKA